MYNKIVNPNTGRKVNINSRLGKKIIKNYLILLGGSTTGKATHNHYHNEEVVIKFLGNTLY